MATLVVPVQDVVVEDLDLLVKRVPRGFAGRDEVLKPLPNELHVAPRHHHQYAGRPQAGRPLSTRMRRRPIPISMCS